MRLHLVAFPHTRVEQEFAHCAYTQKVLKFARMMGDRHEIYVYAPEGPPIPGATLVPLTTDAFRTATFGPDEPNRLPAWPDTAQWAHFNERAAAEIAERLEPEDLVLLAAGYSQLPVAQGLPDWATVVEPGVGYEGPFARFCAFESYAWMHYLYAKRGIGAGQWGNGHAPQDGRWYDTVIPNYFDVDDFPELNGRDGSYLLFVGRLIARKGLSVAAEIAKAADMRLVVAGAGATAWSEGEIVAPEVTVRGDVSYVGPVGVEERGKLMAGARALLAPTTYIEPFGGVAVEAMMCGTPAITTDWGAFTETVEEGVTGYRFRTLREGVRAVELAGSLDPEIVRSRARSRFSLEAVAPRYESWFGRLKTLWGEGWYER